MQDRTCSPLTVDSRNSQAAVTNRGDSGSISCFHLCTETLGGTESADNQFQAASKEIDIKLDLSVRDRKVIKFSNVESSY